ncbi:MAG: ADOP family duplicated permease [Bryobacteraceae bacterium]
MAILSYRLWQRRFGGDAAIVGRKIPLNGEPFEVIGIMPPEYRYPSGQFELWTPLYIPPDEFVDGANYQYIALGRLKPGVGVARARGEMAAIMRQLATDMPKLYRAGSETLSVLVEPLAESDAFQVRNSLYVLLAAVGCLLAIGCMNLGALLIARTSARSHEMALRAALGASAGRLRRQMLAEVLPLALAGSAGGMLLADWILKALLPYLPPTLPRTESIGLHGTAIAFAVAASVAVVLLAGLLPAGFRGRNRMGDALRQNSRSVARGGGLRSMLVVAQIAVAVVLVFAGALFARSLQALLRVDPGYSTRGVITMHLAVTRAKYPKDAQVADYYDRLLARIRTVPGVTAAGVVNRLPLSGIAQTGPVEFENKPGIFDSDWRSATPGYFEAIGIPLKRGRVFQETDRENSPAIGLIDEHLARRVFGVEDPVGKRFRISLGQFRGPWTEIVGVVGHIRNDSPEQDARPQVYWPETQRTQDRGALAVRTMGRPDSFAPQVIEQIRREDAEQPVYDVRSMEEWLARTESSRNLLTALVGVFGGASLVLACLGLYGVVSYTALLRLREFGIRMALGAGAGHVRALVLRQAGRLAFAGSALGLALAWPVSRAIQSLLFGVAPSDVLAWALAPLLLIAVALLAGFGPARRASKADPAVTLRAE